MTIIREVLKHDPIKHKGMPAQNRIIVRSNTYGSNMEHFQQLYDAAKVDFPHLTPKIADIKHYGGRHYKGTYGIEFNVDAEIAVPVNYKEISEVEYTL